MNHTESFLQQLKQLIGTKRIKLFLGEYGSGKTEIAVNYAIKLKQHGLDTAIVDLDLVKPYFRTRESREVLEEFGVRVIAPDYRLSHADLPVLPANLDQLLLQQEMHVIIDVGGGESAVALGQLKRFLSEDVYQALLVVNTKRPFTNNIDGIINVKNKLECVSRLKIDGIVANTNLGEATEIQDIVNGLSLIEESAEKLKLPILWVTTPDWLAEKVISQYPLLSIKRYTRYPWME
ncbi:MAG TPA: hypothetical protein PKA28_02140 [Methylomusa anaerophila]|uniref:Uncharacterized protein n=1 Tax=Methylomusa anaerophila TaxID=1930071 RepID=A0A348APD4_9FIRM|nr:hypothetical protein [Methylomusa anaerophila]BBB92932.1 hypothetical protein MAMMFC1_03640 [Methylomusa anaerophila]HML87233.1 hypothetical protein [Methylomusa anaerophila]